jgi:hypothetical protein
MPADETGGPTGPFGVLDGLVTPVVAALVKAVPVGARVRRDRLLSSWVI